MKIESLMNDGYDWKYVMEYGPAPEEIAEVVRKSEGCNDDEPWHLVVKMNDGRWCYVTAWCDYTGWGCQEGGDHYFASTEEELVRFQLTQSARRELGYEEIPQELL